MLHPELIMASGSTEYERYNQVPPIVVQPKCSIIGVQRNSNSASSYCDSSEGEEDLNLPDNRRKSASGRLLRASEVSNQDLLAFTKHSLAFYSHLVVKILKEMLF